MFFLLYGDFYSKQLTAPSEKAIQQKQKAGHRDVIERYDTLKGDIRNTPLGSRMNWRMESTSCLVPSKTLSSM